MADIDYPEGLPLPARDGYGINHVNPLMRSDLVSGRARQRRRFTSTPSIINITWRMNESQTILFESWFQGVINDGASWFNCPLRTPMGTQPYEARFTGIYGPLTLDGLCGWMFSAEVELRERQVLPGEWAEVLPDFVQHMDIFDMAMNREWPAYAEESDVEYAVYFGNILHRVVNEDLPKDTGSLI